MLSPVAGNSAVATPAASATGSLPLTRVVSRVAAMGKPSWEAACVLLDLTPLPIGDCEFESLFSEQPEMARAAAAASRRVRRGTAAHDIDSSGRFGAVEPLLTDRSVQAIS